METKFAPHFGDKKIRNDFVAKVYSILFVQLAVACSIISLFVFSDSVKNWLKESKESFVTLFFFSIFGFLSISYAFVCIPKTRRIVPLNFILLLLMTLCGSVLLGFISATYETSIVIMAMLATLVIVASITVIAAVCPFDITSHGMVLFFLGFIFFIGLTLAILLGMMFKTKLIVTIMVAIGVFLVGAYLLYDTQLIMGGRSVELSPEEYILGAILLFTDIMNLYIYLLYLFGNTE